MLPAGHSLDVWGFRHPPLVEVRRSSHDPRRQAGTATRSTSKNRIRWLRCSIRRTAGQVPREDDPLPVAKGEPAGDGQHLERGEVDGVDLGEVDR